MEWLESLNNLKPAGAGRADTKARELRRETEELRKSLAEAEIRSNEVCRRALQAGPAGAGDRRLSIELSRFQPELLNPRPQEEKKSLSQSSLGNHIIPELRIEETLPMESQILVQPLPSPTPPSPTEESIHSFDQLHEMLEPSIRPSLADEDPLNDGTDPWRKSSETIARVQTIVTPSPISPLLRDTIAIAPQSAVERVANSALVADIFQEKSCGLQQVRPRSDHVPASRLQATRAPQTQPSHMKVAIGPRRANQLSPKRVQLKISPQETRQSQNVHSPKTHVGKKPPPQKKLPADSTIRKAFIAIDRSWSGRITKEVFLNGIEKKELRTLLAQGFGAPLLSQPREELDEDLEFIFDGLNVELEVFGQPSAPEFVYNMLKLMKQLQPLIPETPRLHDGTKLRWTRLIRAWRRKLADTSIRLPLLALQRLVKRVEAAEDFAELPAELTSQVVLVDLCDWQNIPSAYLLEACIDMARVATALPRFTACDGPGFRDLVKATQRLRSVVLSRLDELSPGELVGITIALLPAPLNDTPLEQRTFITRIGAQVQAFSMAELAALARMFDGMGGYDSDFFVGAARCIFERTSIGLHTFAIVAAADVAALIWLLARYRFSPSGGDHPFEVLSASRSLSSALTGFVPTLSEADLARLIWALGQLNERPTFLVSELGNQVAWRARSDLFNAREYSRITWGLAVLGVRPWNAEAIASNAARAVARADAERNPIAHGEQMPFLEAPELAQLASALGAWAVNDSADLRPLWGVLRRRLADFTGEELLMAVTATVGLGIRDDALITAAQARALVVGPFDSEGTHDFLQCLQGYAHRFGIEEVRSLAAVYAVQAFRHTCTPLASRTLAQCIGPTTIL